MKENFKIKSRIWIEINDKVLLGEGKVKLLRAIEQEGSLSKAAKSIGMSYKKAWNLIDGLNESVHKPLVIKNIGGKDGGGTTLTSYARQLIAAFEDINKSCWIYLDEQAEKINVI